MAPQVPKSNLHTNLDLTAPSPIARSFLFIVPSPSLTCMACFIVVCILIHVHVSKYSFSPPKGWNFYRFFTICSHSVRFLPKKGQKNTRGPPKILPRLKTHLNLPDTPRQRHLLQYFLFSIRSSVTYLTGNAWPFAVTICTERS